MVLKSFDRVIQGPPDNIKKAVTFNLLEDILLYSLTYIHINNFSFILSKSRIAIQNKDLSEQI